MDAPPAAFGDWLDPANDDGDEALVWTDREDYIARPVSQRLSNARNEGAALLQPDPERPPEPAGIDPVSADEEQPRLL